MVFGCHAIGVEGGRRSVKNDEVQDVQRDSSDPLHFHVDIGLQFVNKLVEQMQEWIAIKTLLAILSVPRPLARARARAVCFASSETHCLRFYPCHVLWLHVQSVTLLPQTNPNLTHPPHTTQRG